MSAQSLQIQSSGRPASERLEEIGRALSEARLGNGSRRHFVGLDAALRHDAERAARDALPALRELAADMRMRAQVMSTTSSLLSEAEREAHRAAATHAMHVHQTVDRVVKDLGAIELRMRAAAARDSGDVGMGNALADAVRDAGATLKRTARESQAVERAEHLIRTAAERSNVAARRADPRTVLSQLVDRLGERERNEALRTTLGEIHLHAVSKVHETAALAAQAREGLARASAASHAFDRSLATVYRDPTSARRAFLAEAETRGADAAARAMRDRPQVFGSLATVERRYLGIVRIDDARPAKAAAREAASRARVAMSTAREAPTPEVVRDATSRVVSAKGHEALARSAAARTRTTNVDREIGRLADHLTPEEWHRLKVIATAPQLALVRQFRAQARDAAFGRDMYE